MHEDLERVTISMFNKDDEPLGTIPMTRYDRISPSELQFILDCFYEGDGTLPHKVVNVGKFLSAGIIKLFNPETDFKRYTVTEKGRVWVEEILSTPFPKQVWVSGREE